MRYFNIKKYYRYIIDIYKKLCPSIKKIICIKLLDSRNKINI